MEGRIITTALVFVALYVTDDALVHPGRGVPHSAHLMSGGVLLAALLSLGLAQQRLRPGARAALIALVGMLAVSAGLCDGIYQGVEQGIGGDDLSALAALLAGLVLIATGAVIAWRSRRRDALPRRVARRALVTVGTAAFIYFVMLPWTLAFVFTHAARSSVPSPHLGAAYENVSFRTADGLTLHGWYVPSQNRAAVIAAPGRGGSQKPARILARHGYGVLLFDRRGEGESDGVPNEFGWDSDKDLKAALAYLQSRPDVDSNRIGGIGLSVGGETLLQTAAESPALAAVIADGAGSRSTREELTRPGSAKWGELPTSIVITAGTSFFSNRLPPSNLRDLVGNIAPRPVLFIYGDRDQPNVRDLAPVYYAAAGAPKAIWRVPGASHTGAVDVRPREYERRIVGFFDRALRTNHGGREWR